MKNFLENTTLASIVRDEEDNSAHGIKLWLESTLPYIEKAVIVDTGSIDKTKEILYDYKKRFHNLEVFERPFDDFASSRNYSLEKVRTKRAFILDADELLLPEEYCRLNEYVSETSQDGYNFTFKKIYLDGTVCNSAIDVQLTRLFETENAFFRNAKNRTFYEDVYLKNNLAGFFVPNEIAIIKHFLPSEEAIHNKELFWYQNFALNKESPFNSALKYGWKKRNGGRNFYCFEESKIKEVDSRLVNI